MKIALLYICTGKYDVFWREFYETCESYFIPNAIKEYFVFTDAPLIEYEERTNVHKYFQAKRGWPYDTLMRFETFLQAENELKKLDYIFFFNANMKFQASIHANEILPGAENDGLVAVIHPGYYSQPVNKYPYEKRKTSTAFIPKSKRQYYYQGCLNGGTATAYLKLINTLNQNVLTDLEKGIIAEWHDESHLNSYLANLNPKRLTPAYAYPEGWELPFDAKILMLDKAKLGGHQQLREYTKEKATFLHILKRAVLKRIRKWL